MGQDFGSTNGVSTPVGSSQWSVTLGGTTLTAYGFNANNTPHGLFWKNGRTDEFGIGLANTLDTELTLTGKGSAIANYIQFDVHTVTNSPSGRIRAQSVTDEEKFDLFGSNTKGLIGIKILSGCTNDNRFISIPDWGWYAFISVAVMPQGRSHANDNVLPDAIEVVPEPAQLALVRCGCGLLALLKMHKRQK
jgi:hypothetical protein